MKTKKGERKKKEVPNTLIYITSQETTSIQLEYKQKDLKWKLLVCPTGTFSFLQEEQPQTESLNFHTHLNLSVPLLETAEEKEEKEWISLTNIEKVISALFINILTVPQYKDLVEYSKTLFADSESTYEIQCHILPNYSSSTFASVFPLTISSLDKKEENNHNNNFVFLLNNQIQIYYRIREGGKKEEEEREAKDIHPLFIPMAYPFSFLTTCIQFVKVE